MENLLCRGYRYKFVLLSRTFIAKFDKINGSTGTLFVTEYTDENGKVPGTRTMPLSWIKEVELVPDTTECDIDTIELADSHVEQKRKINKTPKFINNFTL